MSSGLLYMYQSCTDIQRIEKCTVCLEALSPSSSFAVDLWPEAPDCMRSLDEGLVKHLHPHLRDISFVLVETPNT